MQEIIKKIALPVLLLFSFQVVLAQQPTREEKKMLFDKIDTLLVNYIRYSRFLEGADLKITPGAINNFKQLFVSDNVTLPDEMSPLFFDTEKDKTGKKPQLPSDDSLNAEAGKLKNKVPKLQAANTKSKAVLISLKDSLTLYLNGLNNGRDSFYREYNDLSRKLAGFNEEMDLQERIVDRGLADFIMMAEANYQDGFSVKLLNSAVSFNDIENNNVKLLIRKKTEGKIYSSGLKMVNTDTLLLTLRVSQQYSKVLISNIEMIGYKLEFLNDDDRDFIPNPVDACSEERGLFTNTGCADKKETNLKNNLSDYLQTRNTDSVAAAVSLAEVSTKITETEARMSYLDNRINSRPRWVITAGANAGFVDATLDNNTEKNYLDKIIENNPATTFKAGNVIGGFAMLERYFGPENKPANIGIAAGLAFNSISGTVTKDAFNVEYRGVDDKGFTDLEDIRKGGNQYTQIITATGPIEEKVTISNFSVPIVAIYRGDIKKNVIGYKIEAGVALNLLYKSSMSNTNASFDYEAIYNYDNLSGNNYFDQGGTNTPGETSFIITKNFLEDKGVTDFVAYFEDMESRGYPVGLGIGQSEFASISKSASFNPGISFMFRPSISFYFGGSSLNIGAYYIKTSFSQSGGYRLISESREYKTLMQGVSKASNDSYGIHISYSFPLFYPFSKWTKELSGLR